MINTNLKEQVFEYIQKHGAQTNAELVTQFKVLKASMRRTCGDLVRAGKLVPIKSADGCSYGLSADTRAEVAKPASTETPMPAPSQAKKKEEPPPDPKNWRMTDFTF